VRLLCSSARGSCSAANAPYRTRSEAPPAFCSFDLCAVLIELVLPAAPAEAQLRGHGGPIRALAISADGVTALSGTIDASAIRWSLRRTTAEQVLRLHESAVNAVAILKDGRTITASEDARIAISTPGKQEPDAVLGRRSLRSSCHRIMRRSLGRHGIA
jgi:cytochrome c